MTRLDPRGREIPDPTPLQLPAGFKIPETLTQQIQRLTSGALSRHAESQGFETFEEADDFDVPDDPADPSTPYEESFDPTLGKSVTPDEVRRNDTRLRREYLKKTAKERRRQEQIDIEDAINHWQAPVEAKPPSAPEPKTAPKTDR